LSAQLPLVAMLFDRSPGRLNWLAGHPAESQVIADLPFDAPDYVRYMLFHPRFVPPGGGATRQRLC
jgi:hypothetical protein